MRNENSHFVQVEKWPKFIAGPTIPNPGPMLPSVAATELEAVTRSAPSRVTSIVPTTNIKMYKTKKLAMLPRVSEEMVLFPSLTGITAFG